MEGSIQDVLTEWALYTDLALQQVEERKPKVTMKDVPCPEGYRAQICVRKNPDPHTAPYQEYLGRSIIVNEATAAVVFDYGKWAQPHYATKKLNNAIEQLTELEKFRKSAVKP